MDRIRVDSYQPFHFSDLALFSGFNQHRVTDLPQPLLTLKTLVDGSEGGRG